MKKLHINLKNWECVHCSFRYTPRPDVHKNIKCPDCGLTELKHSVVRRIKKLYPNLSNILTRKFENNPYRGFDEISDQHESGYMEGPQNPYYEKQY